MSTTRADQRGSAQTRRPLVPAQVSPLGRLGSWSYRHRRLVAIAWIVVLVVISLAGRLAGSAFKDDLNGGTSTPSQQAAAFLQRNFPSQAGDTAQVVFQTTGPVTAAAARDRITGTLAGLARLPGVASVLSPFAGLRGRRRPSGQPGRPHRVRGGPVRRQRRRHPRPRDPAGHHPGPAGGRARFRRATRRRAGAEGGEAAVREERGAGDPGRHPHLAAGVRVGDRHGAAHRDRDRRGGDLVRPAGPAQPRGDRAVLRARNSPRWSAWASASTTPCSW